jgi:hypothetical protein
MGTGVDKSTRKVRRKGFGNEKGLVKIADVASIYKKRSEKTTKMRSYVIKGRTREEQFQTKRKTKQFKDHLEAALAQPFPRGRRAQGRQRLEDDSDPIGRLKSFPNINISICHAILKEGPTARDASSDSAPRRTRHALPPT